MMNNILLLLTVTLLIACLAANGFGPFVRPIHSSLQAQVRTVLASSAADRNYLYRDEPPELKRKLIEQEEHNVKHSTFHIEKGPVSIDDKKDPVHSVHHHLVSVDHDKLQDLDLRAQKAWTAVNVHEVDVDSVSAAATLFGLFAMVLLLVGIVQ
jgi:hypothetical protein